MDPNSYSSPGVPPKVLMAIVGGLLLLVIIIYVVLSNSIAKRDNPNNVTPTSAAGTNTGNNALPTRSIKPNEIPKDVVAKVGKEYIYEQDVQSQLQDYLNVSAEEARRIILEKITNDSVILQAGEAEGLIALDPTIFNSTTKDYQKRNEAINAIVEKVKGNASSMQGVVVSLWFYNQGEGAAGYEKGKEIAFQKMSQLHADVKAGRMSAEQAANAIRSDAGLAQVDSSYQGNAGFNFDTVEQKRISFSKEFNDMVAKLNQGDVSDLYLAKDSHIETDEMIDAVYMFAQVTKKQGNSNIKNFDEWFTLKKKIYAVTLY